MINKHRMLFWGSIVGGLQATVIRLSADYSILAGIALSCLIWMLAVRYFEARASDFYGEEKDHDLF
jgi:hypothetical protein